ncbi:DUF2586 family protein [Paenibacillus melissococcoides]|uniref:DUF2586 family protein n=1 Tax=Paenibacillus melissococcoides TaxID=2912268 RepID=A0ABN8UFT0_9BACL|nr:DUF2586 family protein [Paenibacillus melissococcoides]CAH8249188.1 DUF2586 family protein [Paenibacillus melissococcoides]
MLRDVTTTITDGGLGIRTNLGEGVHVKIGVAAAPSASPVVISGNMNDKKIKELLGHSPLADAVMDSIENGAGKIYCFPVSPAVPGTVGQVQKDGSGTGSATVTGNPSNAVKVTMQVTESGGLNEAAIRYEVDGLFEQEVTLPLSGVLDIPGTGLKFAFSEAEQDKAKSFLVGDTYTVSTTAPQMSNQDVLAAMDKLRNVSFSFEFVHIVGESAKPLWTAVSEQIVKLRDTYKKPLFAICEAPQWEMDESIDAFVQRLIEARKGLSNYDLQIVSAWSKYRKMDGRTKVVNNAGIVCGLYALAKPQQSIGETKSFSIPETKMLELLPEGIEDYVGLLDEEKYLTFRRYEGLDGFYVTNAKMMAPDGSDYRYAEDVRIKKQDHT